MKKYPLPAAPKPGKQYIKKVLVLDERSTPIARGRRLRKIRNLANLTREQMCDVPGLNFNTFKGWEIARYGGLPADGAVKAINRVAREGVVCTVDWLLHEIGTGPHIITDFDRMQKNAQKPAVAASNTVGQQKQYQLNEVALFRNNYKETMDLAVADDAMAPLYCKGDFVAGVPYFGKAIKKLIGTVCIVQTTDGKCFVRQLEKGSKADTYDLVALNAKGKATPMKNVEVAGAAKILRVYRSA